MFPFFCICPGSTPDVAHADLVVVAQLIQEAAVQDERELPELSKKMEAIVHPLPPGAIRVPSMRAEIEVQSTLKGYSPKSVLFVNYSGWGSAPANDAPKIWLLRETSRTGYYEGRFWTIPG